MSEAIPAQPQFAETPQMDEVLIEAGKTRLEEAADTVIFREDVTLRRGGEIVRADEVVYRPEVNEIDARGDVTVWDKRFVIRGARVEAAEDGSGGAEEAEYWLRGQRGYGTAAHMLRQDAGHMRLLKGSYTTCDPDDPAWQLETGRTDFDFAEDTGISRDVVFRVKGVPLFYTPYLSHPLSDKPKSGLLMPKIGHSGLHGFELGVPYYWHASPHYDFTFTPRLLSKRGMMGGAEFRYLTRRSDGIWHLEYLPGDDAYGEDRSLIQLFHKTRFSSRMDAQLRYEEASDNQYFEDFGNSLALASTVHLTRRADVRYLLPGYYLLHGQALDYQSLLPAAAAKPYRVVPGVSVRPLLPPRNRQLNWQWRARWERFDLVATDNTPRPEASRLHLAPSLAYPLRFAAGFVMPEFTVHYTQYDLDYPAGQVDKETSPSRFAKTFSVDSGMFFDRDVTWRNMKLLQTLEPRLFYQYTPYVNQDDMPVLDTARYDLSWSQLFRATSFSGPDRITDNHSLTAAVSTRFLERGTGLERLRGSIGEVFYFRDRRVRLPNETLPDTDSSAVVAEVAAALNSVLEVSHTLHWNPDDNHSEYSVFRLRYHAASDRLFNLAYRQRDNRLLLEQTDLSWRWPLNRQWRTLGRWNYSLEHDANLETLLGVEYESCCWAVRLMARQYLQDLATDEYETGFYVQIHLKGLGGLGSRQFLEERIPGFEGEF